MKQKIPILIFALFLMLSNGSFEQVLACSCRAEQPVCEAFGNAKAIFVGEVIEGNSIERFSERLATDSNDLTFNFKVKQSFLGVEVEQKIQVHTGFGFGDCGFPFKKGETYLVYAYEQEGKLETNICTRSKHISRVEDDFEELKKLLSKNSGKIYGTVTNYAKSSLEEDSEQPMSNLKLKIEQLDGEKKKFEVTSDENGKYELKNLLTGKYKVVPLLPKGLKVENYATDDFLFNEKGCASKDFYVKNDSSISGKVVDSEGKPVLTIEVELIPVNLKIKSDYLKETTYTRSGGKFQLYNIPPGKYLVAVNYINQPRARNPYPPSFYRSENETSKATQIEVGRGETLEGINFQLPARLPMKEIPGTVVWQDGSPAINVSVDLRDIESNQFIDRVETNDQGNFIVRGFEGRKYIIEASFFDIESSSDETFEVTSLDFLLDNKNREFLLILLKKIENYE